jgi:hypothetical protein
VKKYLLQQVVVDLSFVVLDLHDDGQLHDGVGERGDDFIRPSIAHSPVRCASKPCC